MYSILLTVKKPYASEHEARAKYDQRMDQLNGIVRNTSTLKMLAEGALLLQLNDGLQGVADVVNCLGDRTYSHTILSEALLWYDSVKDET